MGNGNSVQEEGFFLFTKAEADFEQFVNYRTYLLHIGMIVVNI